MKNFCAVSLLILCFCVAAIAQDSGLKILDQPLPELPQNHNTQDVQGTVVLRVQFLDFGEIGEITPLKTLAPELMQRVIVAARKIRFEPETKNGKPITVTKEIQYFYSWNGGWQIPSIKPKEAEVTPGDKTKAEAVIAKAVQVLGGERYLKVTSQIGRGKFSVIRDNAVGSFQSFLDVIVFPLKERTEFRSRGSLTVQVNTGDTGWIFDGDQELIKVQTQGQIEDFKQGIRTSLDNLLRGYWKGEAELDYLGKRPATLGKRNDVVRLTYKDGFTVEFEFADDGIPQKAIHKRTSPNGDETKEEDRYAQFIDVDGIKAAFIIDRFTGGSQSSRINYESIEFNRSIPDSVFAKPANAKDAKKEIKF